MYHYFTDLDLRWTMQGGLKMLSIRLDSTESTQIVSPVVNSSCQKSICTRRHPVRIESSCKVPLTNRLSLGVLDMDWMDRHKILWADCARQCLHCSNWPLKMTCFCNLQKVTDQRLQRTHNQNYNKVRVWIAWQEQESANIRDQLNFNWFSMSGWQYGKCILVIYECKQGFDVWWDFHLCKILLKYWGQTSFEDPVRNVIHVLQRGILNVYKLRTEYFAFMNSFPGKER